MRASSDIGGGGGVKSVGSASRHTPKPTEAPARSPSCAAAMEGTAKGAEQERKTRGEDIKEKKGARVCGGVIKLERKKGSELSAGSRRGVC